MSHAETFPVSHPLIAATILIIIIDVIIVVAITITIDMVSEFFLTRW